MEDKQIVALYWKREERAITASEEKYGPVCRSVSYNILQSRPDAEECVNDTWLAPGLEYHAASAAQQSAGLPVPHRAQPVH